MALRGIRTEASFHRAARTAGMVSNARGMNETNETFAQTHPHCLMHLRQH